MITICDVGPRDGLQNEPDVLAPAVRAQLVTKLAAAGLSRVEAVSFVRDDRVPQMAGAEEVVAAADPGGAELSGLVLNERGRERFAQTSLDRVNCTFAATEEFNRRNGNASLAEAVDRVRAVIACVDSTQTSVTVTVSCAWGCPFEGEVDPGAVAALCEQLDGADELVLADTIGVATPRRVRRLLERVSILGKPVGAHLHNTRNTGYASAWAALDGGAMVLDASVGGLGGCPFSPNATGNIATEDLVWQLERDGVETGVDLDALVAVSQWLEELLGRRLEGLLSRAARWPA
ncbi:MAG: hydroxymethylglutaryl-CoA lyase [Actinobacteria bacterium]|nr:hydroxymethylglutaryl-CoA lyase [Actinomycetota bacterium]